jgi:hypothetical protein
MEEEVQKPSTMSLAHLTDPILPHSLKRGERFSARR